METIVAVMGMCVSSILVTMLVMSVLANLSSFLKKVLFNDGD